jgi:endonuclease/exonuclease/phosphatase family metal-dependent hydrolase
VNYGRSNIILMNLNAQYDAPHTNWDGRKEHLAALIQDEDPDIITLQEIVSMTDTSLLPESRQKQFLDSLEGYDIIGGYANYIMYRSDRFVVENFGMRYFSMPENTRTRNMVWVEFNDIVTGEVFKVYTLHLDHILANTRIDAVNTLLEEIPDNLPVLVAGDFNTLPFGEPVKRMNTRFTDLLTGFGGTHPFLGILPVHIDYIFATEHFYLVEGKVYPTEASDHNVLYARVHIGGEQ